MTNQWVNSYKRLVRSPNGEPLGYEAPVYLSWAMVNRSELLRVLAYKAGREESRRVECRAPDPACNPYLAFSVMLAAGLEGIENEYPLLEHWANTSFGASSGPRRSSGTGTVPG